MKRFLSRLGRFFWSWGFLKFVLVVFALIVLLYVEEDWRGAHELAAAKQRWQDAGVSLNPADYYPAPVPDEQNLAALPVFQQEPDAKGELIDTRLRDATDQDKHGGQLQGYGDDKVELATLVTRAYAKMFPGKTPPASALAQLEELYPIIGDLRTAASTRPEFRLNDDYAHQPPFARAYGLVIGQIAIAKLLRFDAQLAFRENRPQVALEEAKIGFQIARGVAKDPALVGGLVSVGVAAISRAIVIEGLEKKAWNDAQLGEIQSALERFDELSLYQHTIRAECIAFSLPMYKQLQDQPSYIKTMIGAADDDEGRDPLGAMLLWQFWASGWWDMNAAQMADLMFDESNCVDPQARLVNLQRNRELETGVEKVKEIPRVFAPWNILYAVSGGAMTNVLRQFSRAQVQNDEGRLACGLERYRLAHGAYPAGLDALVPSCIDAVPHDVMNGEPYHYRLNADGTFQLYSVGWNGVDDGGKVVYNSYNSSAIDYTKGDWVWPMTKR